MKTVLAAVDFSAVTDAVMLEAIRVARRLRARVVLVHVVSPPSTLRDLFPAGALSAELLLAAKQAAAGNLARLEKKYGRRLPRLEALRLTGEPVASIVTEAARRGAEYIVIGAHGQTAIFDLLTGSVVRGVLARARCPVVVVPAGAERTVPPARRRKRP